MVKKFKVSNKTKGVILEKKKKGNILDYLF